MQRVTRTNGWKGCINPQLYSALMSQKAFRVNNRDALVLNKPKALYKFCHDHAY